MGFRFVNIPDDIIACEISGKADVQSDFVGAQMEEGCFIGTYFTGIPQDKEEEADTG